MAVDDAEATRQADRVRAGDRRAAARLMRDLDDGRAVGVATLVKLRPHTGRAFVVGITGSPGAGKSTLVDALCTRWRALGQRVAVVAIDPTSTLSGGALLGDRVRMQSHATDPGVFIRSLATRGALGGLSRSTADVIDVFDAMGFDLVLVETVGVGQDEVDVVAATDLAVVVTVPGLGDGVQALKAGLLELADILVVNKADREGADGVVRDLEAMLTLREVGPRDVPVLKTAASAGQGVDPLVALIDERRQSPAHASSRAARRRRRAAARVEGLVSDALRTVVRQAIDAAGGPAALADQVITQQRDPREVAAAILATMPRTP